MLRSPNTKCHSNPDLSNVAANAENVTQRKRKQPESEIADAIKTLSQEINKKLDDWRSELYGAMSKISDSIANIKTDLSIVTKTTSDIKTELNSLRSDHNSLEKQVCNLNSKNEGVIEDILSLKNSVKYVMDEQEDLKIQMTCMQSKCTDAVSNLFSSLEAKIDYLEQQARQCNLELCNIPEKRNENLVTVMENICSKINFSLCQKDIIAIHRVPHAHAANKSPKNIIVKLNSRILRDNLLSAFRLAKGLNTHQLEFGGTSLRVYMHEHLTLKNKHLFRQSKEAASSNKFKYVWVKHATILVRETDSERAIAIRSPKDIAKIKASTGQSKQ